MSTAWASDSLFYRQVNPNWLAGGVPSSQAFGPTPKDKDALSVDDAARISAEGSWRHFTEKLFLSSVGTWAVSLGEVEDAKGLVLTASPKVVPEDPSKDNPAHCDVDFSRVSSKGEKKRKAQFLAMKATSRGCLYAPAS
jgi:hypothetical protein